jgi:hypothetical protein
MNGITVAMITNTCTDRHSIQAADSESMGASAAATASDGTVHYYWHHIHTSGCLPESSEQQHCTVQSQVSLTNYHHTTL